MNFDENAAISLIQQSCLKIKEISSGNPQIVFFGKLYGYENRVAVCFQVPNASNPYMAFVFEQEGEHFIGVNVLQVQNLQVKLVEPSSQNVN